jgi:hypothetical protein
MELQTAIEILEYHQQWRLGLNHVCPTIAKPLLCAGRFISTKVKLKDNGYRMPLLRKRT